VREIAIAICGAALALRRQTMLRARSLRYVPLVGLALAACAGDGPGLARPSDGPLATHAALVAEAAGVPRDLFLAIAQVEGGLTLPARRIVRPDDDVPVAGLLELRHGAFNSLARGAELTGFSEDDLRADTDLGTEAGALVLGELGRQHGARAADLDSWRESVRVLSGIQGPYLDRYLAEVWMVLRGGGAFPARDGETVYIPPHPELPVPAVGHLDQATNMPDFPGAIWFPTSCVNKCTPGRPLGQGSVNKIVIHDTEGSWAGSVATLQNDPGKSVHYIVDVDGSRVGQFLHESDTAWHAGNYYYNETSVGIEHVGMAADPAGYQDKLYATSVKLVKDIRTRHTVPLDRTHIVGHYQVPNGNKIAEDSAPCTDALNTCETSPNYGGADRHTDPGVYWMWCQYMQMLGGSCTCNDTYNLWNCTTDKTLAVRCTNGQVQIEQCFPCEPQPNGMNDICHPMAGADMAQATDGGVKATDGGVKATDGGVKSGSDGGVVAGSDGSAPRDASVGGGGGSDAAAGGGSAVAGCEIGGSAGTSGAWALALALIALVLARALRRQ
jgi:N-acetyl-anhydromuramyl-L-alanine amidase AmpD